LSGRAWKRAPSGHRLRDKFCVMKMILQNDLRTMYRGMKILKRLLAIKDFFIGPTLNGYLARVMIIIQETRKYQKR